MQVRISRQSLMILPLIISPTVIEFTKSSLTTGKELPGCKLKVVDADGNIVDEWTSGKEAHVIRELTVGKEYTTG